MDNTIEKIRVSSGIKVEVNDDGETITIPVEDVNFMDRFYNMIDCIKASAGKLTSTNTDDTREQLKIIIGECNNISQEMDNLFGQGSCRKIFGDVTPTPYAVIDFYNQIGPIIERYASERQRKIMQKYNVNDHQRKRKKYHKKVRV